MLSLRSAITYINCLQDLLKDCDAGRVGEDIYRRSILLDVSEKQKTNAEKNTKQSREKRKTKKKQLVMDKTGGKKAVCDKWTNYSQKCLEQKCCCCGSSCNSQEPIMTDTASPTPSSPRDVNEISLHISLMDNYRDIKREEVLYVYTVHEI